MELRPYTVIFFLDGKARHHPSWSSPVLYTLLTEAGGVFF